MVVGVVVGAVVADVVVVDAAVTEGTVDAVVEVGLVVRWGTSRSMSVGVVARTAVDGVVADASSVETVREGRSVTWSRTSPTAWEASAIARRVAASQAANSPRRRVLIRAVSPVCALESGNGRLKVR